MTMKVAKWDKWQTFRKDRGTPPWIKVYRNLMTNEAWVSLTDAEKGQLVSIWILAADKDGSIPDNPAVIQRMAMLDSKPNINKFIELEFLTTNCQPDDNHVVTTCREVDAPEKRQRQSREEKDRSDYWSKHGLKHEWSEFKKMRRKLRKPVSDIAESRLVAKHKRLVSDGNDKSELINMAIERCWLSFYPVGDQHEKSKHSGNGIGGKIFTTPSERNKEAAAQYFGTDDWQTVAEND